MTESNFDNNQLPLDLLGEPDLQGHKHFCAPMCAIWMAHYGADTIDDSNLALFKWHPNSCPQCRIDAFAGQRAPRRPCRPREAYLEKTEFTYELWSGASE